MRTYHLRLLKSFQRGYQSQYSYPLSAPFRSAQLVPQAPCATSHHQILNGAQSLLNYYSILPKEFVLSIDSTSCIFYHYRKGKHRFVPLPSCFLIWPCTVQIIFMSDGQGCVAHYTEARVTALAEQMRPQRGGEDCSKFRSSTARNGTSSAAEQMRGLVRSSRSVCAAQALAVTPPPSSAASCSPSAPPASTGKSASHRHCPIPPPRSVPDAASCPAHCLRH